MIRATSSLFILPLLVLAGCADATPGTPQGSDTPSSATTTAIEGPTGTVEGSVIDDERRPLAGAFVVLVELGQSVVTVEDGAFLFSSVPLGSYEASASKPGHFSQAKRVEVQGDEPVRVQFILEAVPTSEAYVEIFPHRALIHYGNGDVNWFLNNTGSSNACDRCSWIVRTREPSEAAYVEVYGKHAVSNPAAACDNEWYYLWEGIGDRLTTGDGGGRVIVASHSCLPIKVPLDKSRLRNATVFVNRVHCERTWVCFEEPRDVYLSLFHYSSIPEGYTVRPP